MRVRDYQVPEPFVKMLRRCVLGFARLEPNTQVRLAYFVWIAGCKARSHLTLERCASFSYQELEDAFGRGQFNELNSQLGIFDVTEEWSTVLHTTKGYRLSALVQKAKDQYLSNHVSLYSACSAGTREPITLLSMNARPVVTLPQVLAAKDTDGNTATAWRDIKLPHLVPVDLVTMQHLHRHLVKLAKSPETDLFSDASSAQIELRIESLANLIVLATTESAGMGKIV